MFIRVYPNMPEKPDICLEIGSRMQVGGHSMGVVVTEQMERNSRASEAGLLQ